MRVSHARRLVAALCLSAVQAATASSAEELLRAIRADDMGALARVLSNDPGSADLTLADGTTPLTQAAYLERTTMVARLQAARTSLTFFEACIVGDLTAVRRALARGQDVNQLSPDGFSPLGLAVFFRRSEVARLLIDAGADVRLRSRNALQVAPIHSAVARGDLAMLQTLLLRGADPDQTQQRLMRPIHEAAAAGATPIVAMLLMFGADPAVRSEDGRSAADFAAASGHVELARRLESLASRGQ